MEFTLEPYIGALPLTFEMGPGEVEKTIGPVERSTIKGGVRVDFRWSGKKPWMPVHVFYSAAEKLEEIEFNKDCVLKYKGIDLFRRKNVLNLLAKEDTPKEYMGTVFFFKLGIAMRGFHDPETDKNITVFRKGKRDRNLAKMADLKLPR